MTTNRLEQPRVLVAAMLASLPDVVLRPETPPQ